MGKKGMAGKKTCPACHKSVGARTRECPCGHVFEVKAPKARPSDKSDLGAVLRQIKRVEEFRRGYPDWPSARQAIQAAYELISELGGIENVNDIADLLEGRPS